MNQNFTPSGAGTSVLPKPKTLRRPGRLWSHKDVNGGDRSFAGGLNAYKLIWVFIIGSVIGSVYEGLIGFIAHGCWQRSSAVLLGPFTTIYGLGAVLFVLLGHLMRGRSKMEIFFAISILGGTYEYVSGMLEKAIFGTLSWDYTGIPGSIGAHANLFIALCWGLMGIAYVAVAQPFLSEMIERIPNACSAGGKRVPVGRPLTVLLAVFMAANIGFTWLVQLRSYERQQSIPAENAVSRWIDDTYPDTVLKEKFPNMEYVFDAA